MSGFTGPAMRSKVVNTTYDVSTASGTQNITGFGFNPTAVSINYGMNAAGGSGVGFAAGGAQGTTCVNSDNQSVSLRQTGAAIFYSNAAASAFQLGVVSFIADGIQITWTKTGAPTGTLGISVLGMQ